MREEVAAAGSQQVHLLADIILQFVKACFGSAHLGLNLRHKGRKMYQMKYQDSIMYPTGLSSENGNTGDQV